ncbi:MAG: serine hydrolase domain-containing protein [Candidatus Kapabacteria bacterium]|nr:serine hydrolase domain-containing protein [Candidatus Kapabacteria bacterium]
MKNRIFNFLFFAVLVALTACSKEDSITSGNSDIQTKLQTLVENELQGYKNKFPDYPGGLTMKILAGNESYFASAGMGSSVTDGIHFRAASNTKTFTSAAILYLYQQGKLDINHKITDIIPGTNQTYLPNTPEYDIPFKNSITILDLLRHRAGVFDVSNDMVPDTVSAPLPYKGKYYLEYIMEKEPEHTFTFDELVNVVTKTGLYYFTPDNGYHYSNTGYSLLGKIIERVSGKSYQNYMMEEIITPIGLTNTTMPVLGTDRNLPEPYAKGYIYMNGSQTDVSQSNISANVAEGTLITTPYDLSKFLRTLLSGKSLLSPHTVNSVMMNCLPTSSKSSGKYGCGLTYTQNLGYGHNGAHEGYLSMMVYDPQIDLTIVIFTNTWNMKDGMNSLVYQLSEFLESTAYKAKEIVKKED